MWKGLLIVRTLNALYIGCNVTLPPRRFLRRRIFFMCAASGYESSWRHRVTLFVNFLKVVSQAAKSFYVWQGSEHVNAEQSARHPYPCLL